MPARTDAVGDCAGFKAGVRDGHCLQNRSTQDAEFLVVGSRVEEDFGEYPDIDMMFLPGDGGFRRKDGSEFCMADVFVSYARSDDKARVAPVVAAIESKGGRSGGIRRSTPGQEFDDQIDAEITAATGSAGGLDTDLGDVALGARRGT